MLLSKYKYYIKILICKVVGIVFWSKWKLKVLIVFHKIPQYTVTWQSIQPFSSWYTEMERF
jgi:hypothetical protein